MHVALLPHPLKLGRLLHGRRGRRDAVHLRHRRRDLEAVAELWLPEARVRGDVQRPHGQEAGHHDLLRTDVLPAPEAYGGR